MIHRRCSYRMIPRILRRRNPEKNATALATFSQDHTPLIIVVCWKRSQHQIHSYTMAIERKNKKIRQIKDGDSSEAGNGSGNTITSLQDCCMLLLSSTHNDGLLNDDEKSDFHTSCNLNFPADESLEKEQHSLTEMLRRDLFTMKQTSFKNNGTAPFRASVRDILLLAMKCVDAQDHESSSLSYDTDILTYDDDESLLDDYDDELNDSIHLAKRRFGRSDSSDPSRATPQRRGDLECIGDSVDPSVIGANSEPGSRSTLRANAA
jgi:hypothetical protein